MGGLFEHGQEWLSLADYTSLMTNVTARLVKAADHVIFLTTSEPPLPLPLVFCVCVCVVCVCVCVCVLPAQHIYEVSILQGVNPLPQPLSLQTRLIPTHRPSQRISWIKM